MNFKKDKYTVIRKAISKELAVFISNYFNIKKQVYSTMIKHRYLSPFELMMGTFKDTMVPNTYSHYSDIAMETLLLKCQPEMEKVTGLKLSPAYTYARIYKKGDVLKKHTDRFSCEISTTMFLGGDEWPIYLKQNEKDKPIEVNLKQGDMLIYRGEELEHWRNKFTGKECIQVFLHYNNTKTKGAKENLFDRRPHIGLPNYFRR